MGKCEDCLVLTFSGVFTCIGSNVQPVKIKGVEGFSDRYIPSRV